MGPWKTVARSATLEHCKRLLCTSLQVSYLKFMTTADVVIVGGGIVGASIAYQLTKAGCRNVLMLEREAHQGKGSTGKSMGGVRAQFSTDVSIQMSLYSIPFLARFEEVTGRPSGYKPHGYL